MRHTELTVKEFARKERVHQVTVRRWIAKGAIEIRRTPGGGVRIPVGRESSGVVVVNISDGLAR